MAAWHSVVMGICAALGAVTACTAFYDLEPDPRGTPTGGSGGGAPETEDRALLPKLDAAHLCALVATCPTLGPSLVASSGLPVVELDASGAAVVLNYAACVDWLTFPLGPAESGGPAARLGFDLLRDLVLCMAASASCEDATRCAFAEVLAPDDPRCEGGSDTSCEADGDTLWCDSGVRMHCDSALFAPDSSCVSPAVGRARCASGLCTGAEVDCSQGYLFACLAEGQPKVGVQCAAFGLTCDDASTKPAERGCFGAAGSASCTTFGEQSCAPGNDQVRTCAGLSGSQTVNGLFHAEIDCSVVDEVCATDAGVPGPARCVRADATCSPYDPTVNVCSGSVLSLCLDGAPDSVDCAAIGRSCVPAAGAATGHCG